MKKILIGKNDENKRLDSFLTKILPRLPQSLLYKYIRKKRVKINGRRAEISSRLHLNDVIELYINDEFFAQNKSAEDFKNAPTNISIIFEDENILILAKKPGLIVHADSENQIDCLINRVKNYLFLKGAFIPEKENSFAPALINRIDRNTMGLILAAKNAESLAILNEKMKNHEIKKKYLCIVLGKMLKKEDVLTGFLEKDELKNKVFVSNKYKYGAKNIATKYKILDENKDFSLLEVELLTGRTHQIRAHLAQIGHPILGDGKYGNNCINKTNNVKFQALCAYKLKFDFKDDAGILNYLNKQEFSVDKSFIFAEKNAFVRLFPGLQI